MQRRRTVTATVLSLGLAGLFYAVLRLAKLPLLPTAESAASVGFGAVLAYAMITCLGVALKTVRWHWQLEPIASLPFTRMLSANLLGSAALVLLPFRTGEAVRPSLIARGGQISFVAAATTSVAERLADGLIVAAMLLGCLSVAPLLDPLPDHVGSLPISAAIVATLGYAASGIVLAAAALLAAFYTFRNRAVKLIRRSVGGLAPRAASWLEAALLDACRGLDFATKLRLAVPFALCSVGYWFAYWGGTWFILSASGIPSVSLAEAGVVSGTVAFGLAGPNAPGFFGSFQAAAYASLALFYSTPMVTTQGAVAVFWMYAINLMWTVVPVPLGLWLNRRARIRAAFERSA